ncbi:LysE family translocator [Candidatus Cryosericum septentrionale]|uniref:LysE family translocator n=2 Tax=Candidatus Cryosericum septentrionale TaxID=2290913 RepID=A0A398DQP6_9BACT|nr:LysE family translocator [Candidatus Cryosericum septentrionale]
MQVMGIELLPVLGYALVSIFTPGPNNITSSSLGMRVGYPRTLRFIGGVVTGFFCIMVASGLLTELVVSAYDRIAVVLKIAGVAYLLWIAWTVARPQDHAHASPTATGTRYRDGLLLQLVNPKVILFGLTMYATLLAPLAKSWVAVVISAVLLAVLSFCSTSLWALLGAGIQRFIANSKVRFAYSLVLVGLLLYAAWSIVAS